MQTWAPADQMHSGSVGAHSVLWCVDLAAKVGRKGAHRLQNQNHLALCRKLFWEEMPLWDGSLRVLTNSTVMEKRSIQPMFTAQKNGPRLLQLVLNMEKSVCFMVSAWGVTLKFLGEKRLPPPSSWTLGMVSVKGEGLGPLLCHFPIRNPGVNY